MTNTRLELAVDADEHSSLEIEGGAGGVQLDGLKRIDPKTLTPRPANGEVVSRQHERGIPRGLALPGAAGLLGHGGTQRESLRL
jgi:hypothetical protein